MSITRRPILKSAGIPALLALAAVLAGCDTVRAPATVRQDPLEGGYPRIVGLEQLEEVLVVETPIVDEPTDGRPLKVTVPLRNVSDRPVSLQYRYTFRDERGREMRHDSGWRHMRLEPRLQANAEANALSTEAVDWRMEIRPER